jgi:hypothetical protein
VSWNVGGPTPEGGLFLDGWYRPLAVGEPLPSLPLVLAAGKSLLIDLERTYAEAAHRAYLDRSGGAWRRSPHPALRGVGFVSSSRPAIV